MNMLEKIDALMKERNLNKSQLAMLADVPYTTLDGLYKKGYENIRLPTLRKLSKFFGVSMEFLSGDDDVKTEEKSATEEIEQPINENAVDLAKRIMRLSQQNKGRALDYLELLESAENIPEQ